MKYQSSRFRSSKVTVNVKVCLLHQKQYAFQTFNSFICLSNCKLHVNQELMKMCLTLCLLGNFHAFFQNSFTNTKCQTVWTQIKSDILSDLIWVQTVCKGYQQTELVGKVNPFMPCVLFVGHRQTVQTQIRHLILFILTLSLSSVNIIFTCIILRLTFPHKYIIFVSAS